MGFPMPCLLLFLLCLASFLDCLAQGQGERCGIQGGGPYDTCHDGRCCSAFGYCGTTQDYCGAGCQSHCGERCGSIAGGAQCQGSGRCCSNFGFCGSGPDYCKPGNCQSQCGERCGPIADGAQCRGSGRCCSIFNYCGSGPKYCKPEICQSQCTGGAVDSNISSSKFDEFLNISSTQFDEFLKHLNDATCRRKNFYTYDAFVAAAHHFGGFATTGDTYIRKREIAAFFAQTSTGRCGGDDPTIYFETALSFWMTPQSPKPSCHDVITGKWTASAFDKAAGRVPGFGVITNIISGRVECGKGSNPQVAARIGFYKRYCDILGVSYGDNLDCYNQSPWMD